MVARELQIGWRNFTLKQTKLGCFDCINFLENGKDLGSLSMELTIKLSEALHHVAEFGNKGCKFWKDADLLQWLVIHLRTNKQGSFLHITWAKKARKSQRFLLVVPEGFKFLGWKRFAIAIDSLNPEVSNFASTIFPCAEFAGKSRSYNLVERKRKITRVDAIGQSNIGGIWNNGVICYRSSDQVAWKQIGLKITESEGLFIPFDILPVNRGKAIFIVDDESTRTRLFNLKDFTVLGSEISFSPWHPRAFANSSSRTDFWLSLSGVPHHVWTVDTLHNLAAHCGDLLLIDPSTLTLADLTTVRLKVRNLKGINDLPRMISLQTIDGDFEIQVNVMDTGVENLPANPWITIDDIGNGSTGKVSGEASFSQRGHADEEVDKSVGNNSASSSNLNSRGPHGYSEVLSSRWNRGRREIVFSQRTTSYPQNIRHFSYFKFRPH